MPLLQFLAYFEYLTISLLPALFFFMVRYNIEEIAPLLVAMCVEYAIASLPYKLSRPRDEFLLALTQLIHCCLLYYQLGYALALSNSLLRTLLTAKIFATACFISGMASANLYCMWLQGSDSLEHFYAHIGAYRALMSRLYGYACVDEADEEDDEAEEDALPEATTESDVDMEEDDVKED
jgi:hypothetical protein